MKGAPANPMSGVAAELGDRARDALADRRERVGIDRAQAQDVGRRADRRVQHRAAPGDDLDRHAGQPQRDDDVAEEHGRIHAVAADRLQGDLAGQLGIEARIEHRGADAQRAVLGKAAAGLAHEPDRGALGTLTAQGCDQRRRSGPTVTRGGATRGKTYPPSSHRWRGARSARHRLA